MKRCALLSIGIIFAVNALVFCETNAAPKKSASATKAAIAKVKKRSAQKNAAPVITAPKQSVVMDFDTGEVLAAQDMDVRCAPSSMTKLMTIYLTFEALEEGRLNLTDELPVSEYAKSQEGSRSFFESGTLAKVEDLIRSMIVHSGNDACVVIAEKLAGDETAFANIMNEKAAQFSLRNTHFMNSTGLPHEEHFSSMYDLAVITKHLITDFPQYYHYFSEKTFSVNGITQQNRNTLLGNSLGVDGLKTGHTSTGGFGIVISGVKDGKRLVCVVNGCPSTKARSTEANRLLAQGFNEYVTVKIARSDTPIATAAVDLGKLDKVNLYVDDNIDAAIPKNFRQSLVVGINVKEPFKAPVIAGTKVGVLTYKYGSFTSKEYPLFVRDSVAEMNILEIIIAKIKDLFFKKKQNVEAPMTLDSLSSNNKQAIRSAFVPENTVESTAGGTVGNSSASTESGVNTSSVAQ